MSTWKINPATGDYLMENGAPVSSDSLVYPAYYRIRTPRLQWMYAPDVNFGSDLYTIKKKSGNSAINMVQKACQPMIDDGRALAVDPAFSPIQPNSRNMAALEVVITDALGLPETLPLPQIGD